jgi:MoxR-like ATPase
MLPASIVREVPPNEENDADLVGLAEAIDQVDRMVLGKQREVRLAFTCLLAGGHLLLDDLPGLGKTTLARSIAASVDLTFQRIQFTSDLMPSDILGISMLDQSGGNAYAGFRFHQGPIFTNLLLADEINRASPRAQSALLEAMAERQVTVDGVTHTLPDPFFVIATQNPVDLSGTFPLPDSQLDRFLLRLHLGYPDDASEMELLRSEKTHDRLPRLKPVLGIESLITLRQRAAKLHASDPVIRYIHALVKESRQHPGVRAGLSPRAGLALLDAARAYAMIHKRTHVLPDDVQALFEPVAAHRLIPTADRGGTIEGDERERQRLAKSILSQIKVP